MTQNVRLLEYLKTHKQGITQMEAFTKLGICRLSERIWEIEHGEWGRESFLMKRTKISRKRERVKTRYGYATVTRYRLA